MEDFYVDYSALDLIQRAYVDKRLDKHTVVTGGAGSGKSVLALYKLQQVTQRGTYALIVFTKSLKKYFKDGIASMQRNRQNQYDEIVNVDENCIFYYSEWKNWRVDNPNSQVDYLIVDECQDFTEEQVDDMIAFGKTCFFFGDPAQTIMDFGDKINIHPDAIARKLGVRTIELQNNYRLTIETAKVVEQVPHPIVDTHVSENCVRHGAKPKLFQESSFDAQLDKIIRIIQNASLTNVGILLRFNSEYTAQRFSNLEKRSVEYVKNYFESKNITVEYKYNINRDTDMDLDFSSSNPKIMTWWCAKGLQFKHVFMIDCDHDYIGDETSDKSRKTTVSAWYVALSRASERLFLLSNGRICNRFPSPLSGLFG